MGLSPLRVLLDSNVWRYLADADALNILYRISKKRSIDVLSAPSVVYEALRTKDPMLRDKLCHATARTGWTKLMPEAFEEAEEFIREVRRIRPSWIVLGPNLRRREKNRRDWQDRPSSFWSRARQNPGMVARHIANLEHGVVDVAREQFKNNSKVTRDADWRFEKTQLRAIYARPLGDLPGWDGSDIEHWRLQALYAASRLFGTAPYADWILPLVQLPRAPLTDRSWVRFWLYDTIPEHMPRWWIREACNLLLSLRKVSPGAPCDAQLATYLFSADVFVTADRVLADALGVCRECAPHPMAQTCLVRAGIEGVTELLQRLDIARHV